MQTCCVICGTFGDHSVLVWDDEDEGYRHDDCSWDRADRVVPELVRRLRQELGTAETLVMHPDPSEPTHAGYLRAHARLRHIADLAAYRLERLAPTGRSLEAVLADIVAEGHEQISVRRNVWSSSWECTTYIGGRLRTGDESVSDWHARVHCGEGEGKTPSEAAENRLRDIRAGKGLAVLISWFLPPAAAKEPVPEPVAHAEPVPVAEMPF